MKILKDDLNKMNDMLEKGKKISEITRKYPKYDYWDIYWQVNDYSFLGKKRSITNRLNKLKMKISIEERRKLVDESQEMLDELYDVLKKNSAKLIKIDSTLRE